MKTSYQAKRWVKRLALAAFLIYSLVSIFKGLMQAQS